MDLGLADRVYVITGGSKGLGFATAAALVADGARVVISSRTKDNVDAAVAALGPGAAGVAGDNADPGLPEALVDRARAEFGRIDGLLVSVGGPPPGSVLETTEDTWNQAFGSVFLGTMRLIRRVAEELSEGGAIGLVLSTSVREPLANLAVSNGLRPGLAMAAKTLATELGPRGVRVVSLLPGAFATDRAKQIYADPDVLARRTGTIPLRRLGNPEEFGRFAAFALSPAASYLTGVTLTVDGGATHSL
ncbi:MAG TPA: SDR family oxidoreductase [Pseudonocardiaceae bacterium]|jgi:3-oxoacyl-[acyl-carrier protein] reductase|nr:SDR family oxidoreductase [Pseudonocardiaceae bacterium]